ncbi:hypothetical protein M427DRAFT_309957 [Gonapodya prolifera JEL478]|uniref:Uncharacterized protein n=1 Tax=Gonapodya prolifera (strain JEL478) TaxID=1344416 RepID=A0A139AGP3_GONPJ|nr:hypothetical protein M427DRAFT_309957 [Gonapodya prolifera JEL478]|eukprot:KXS15859.1 hypothetical protein M427DRAFT_309957 [Gonapodya prolifera JEL478]
MKESRGVNVRLFQIWEAHIPIVNNCSLHITPAPRRVHHRGDLTTMRVSEKSTRRITTWSGPHLPPAIRRLFSYYFICFVTAQRIVLISRAPILPINRTTASPNETEAPGQTSPVSSVRQVKLYKLNPPRTPHALTHRRETVPVRPPRVQCTFQSSR